MISNRRGDEQLIEELIDKCEEDEEGYQSSSFFFVVVVDTNSVWLLKKTVEAVEQSMGQVDYMRYLQVD